MGARRQATVCSRFCSLLFLRPKSPRMKYVPPTRMYEQPDRRVLPLLGRNSDIIALTSTLNSSISSPPFRKGAGQEKEREKGQAARPTPAAEAGPGTANLERGGHSDVLHESGAATRHLSGTYIFQVYIDRCLSGICRRLSFRFRQVSVRLDRYISG